MKFQQFICCITILLYLTIPCFAFEDKKLPNGNIEVEASQYIGYINTMTNDAKEIRDLLALNVSLKKIIETQTQEINLFKNNILSFKQEITYQEMINQRQEDYIKWGDKRIDSYRKEVKRLESRPEGFWRRTKDILFWPTVGLAIGSIAQQLSK